MFFFRILIFSVLSVSAFGSEYFELSDIRTVDTFGSVIKELRYTCCPKANRVIIDRSLEENKNIVYATRYFYDLPPIERLLILAQLGNFSLLDSGNFIYVTKNGTNAKLRIQQRLETQPWVKQFAGRM